jgi:hypothetical protein
MWRAIIFDRPLTISREIQTVGRPEGAAPPVISRKHAGFLTRSTELRLKLAIASIIIHYPQEEATAREDETVADGQSRERQSKSRFAIALVSSSAW